MATLHSFPSGRLIKAEHDPDNFTLDVALNAPKVNNGKFVKVFDKLTNIWATWSDDDARLYAENFLNCGHVFGGR